MRFFRRIAAGAEAGLLAGAGVAVFFLIQDGIQLQPLSTPVALASGALGGPAEVDGTRLAQVAAFSTLGAKLVAYTVFHFAAFAAVGVAGAFLLEVASFWTSLLGGVLYGSAVCTGLLYGVSWIAEVPVALDVLGVQSVLLVNAMAGAILGVGLHLAQSEPEGVEAA